MSTFKNNTLNEMIIVKGGTNMTKNYQELVKGRIFIGGAANAKEVVENEKADIVFD